MSKANEALDKMAENARELGLDYDVKSDHRLMEMPAQQEPVAYWIPKAEQFCIADPSGRPFAKAWEPLYTSPPAQRTWVGLTEEELQKILQEVSGQGWKPLLEAIEAKLKEKNNG